MFILRLISQPKVERNLLDKYHVGNWDFRNILNYMVTKQAENYNKELECFRHLSI